MSDLGALSIAWAGHPAYRELTTRQTAILTICCDEGPQQVRTLARRIRASKPVVTRAHSHLARLGLLDRMPDPKDKRSCFIIATDAGRSLRDALRNVGNA